MKTYFICNVDSYGQRSGTYYSVQLSDDQIEISVHGFKLFKGRFLYESELEVIRACQD